jgi:MFS family permease
MYAKLKQKGATSKNPIKESFGNKYNRGFVALALFGATMGQGVVWYTGQFYALFYLQKIFGVSLVDSNMIIGGGLLVATPFFVFFGHLSDKIGRKYIMLTGMVLAVLTYLPIYKTMANYAPFTTFITANDPGNVINPAYSPFMLGVFIFIQVIYVTMVYGPIAAFLVELFPTKIRYTSMSLPYHIGNGVFGGLVPIIGLTMIEVATKPDVSNWLSFLRPLITPFGNYAGLLYPMLIAAICAVIGFFKLPETFHIDIESDASVATLGKKAPAGD